MISERQRPGQFVEGIEPMLEPAALRCLHFHTRLFAIESVEHADRECAQRPRHEMAGGKENRRYPAHDVAEHG